MVLKKSISQILICLLILVSCNSTKDCNEDRIVYVKVSFQKAYYTSVYLRAKDTVVAKTVINWPGYTDTLLKVSSFKLPLNLMDDKSAFECIIDTNYSDTICFYYKRNQVFINYDCGFRTDFTIDSLVSKNNYFDSVQLVHPYVTNTDEIHIKVFLPNPVTTQRTR